MSAHIYDFTQHFMCNRVPAGGGILDNTATNWQTILQPADDYTESSRCYTWCCCCCCCGCCYCCCCCCFCCCCCCCCWLMLLLLLLHCCRCCCAAAAAAAAAAADAAAAAAAAPARWSQQPIHIAMYTDLIAPAHQPQSCQNCICNKLT